MEEHFGGSRVMATLLFVAAIAFGALGLLPGTDKETGIFLGCLAAGEFSVAVLIMTINVTLDPMGLRYKSAAGEHTLLWSEVDRFYYSSTKVRINLIPAGTYYSFKFKTTSGAKLTFGNSVGNAKELGQKLIERTYKSLFDRAATAFDAGQEVDFDAIKISKQNGVTMKRALRKITIPWKDVASYKIADGKFYIFKRGERFASAPSLKEVANAFVLFGMLNVISAPVAEETFSAINTGK